MIDIAILRGEPERVKSAIAAKKADPALVDGFLALDAKWRQLRTDLDNLRAQQKQISASRDVAAGQKNKEAIKAKEAEIADIEKERDTVWMRIPNLASDDTPIGKSEEENQVVRQWGTPKKTDFKPLDHVELGERLGIVDIQSAGKVSGTRFAYLKGDGAMLEFALVSYTLKALQDREIMRELAVKIGPAYPATPFVPVVPPVMIRPEVFARMARLEPEEERYYFPRDDMYLIGSAEHTLGPLHMDETLPEERLPIRYVGFSTAFRREAGSYGKDTRGILRVHQFDKLEMESFVLPEHGHLEQDFFVAIQEYLVQSLGIPYQILSICTGDMGNPNVRQIDLEMWMPAQGRYRETHTSDYMGDYQSRRLATKVKRRDGQSQLVHMNDATAFAVGRTLIAIMENYQTQDGKIEIPDVLQPYMGKAMIE